MKRIYTFIVLLSTVFSFAQSLNDYKYVIVPKKFDFQKSEGEFEMNNVARMMFEKYGFNVLMEGSQFPDDVALDRCKALYANIANSGLMHTNLTVVLKDCTGATVFSSVTGRSKLKDKRKAYGEALREAAPSFAGLDYQYSGDEALKTAGKSGSQANGNISSVKTENNPNQLTAKSTAYGYELVDAKGKHFLKMYKTSQPDSFSAQMESINGVVFKKGNEWFFEYYVNDKPVSQKLDIRF